MEVTETVKRLDDEVKIIKNEIQAVLLDIRESYLNRENPFNPEVSAPTISSVVAASMMGSTNSAGNGNGNNKKNDNTRETGSDVDTQESPENKESSKDASMKKETKVENNPGVNNLAAEEPQPRDIDDNNNGVLEPETDMKIPAVPNGNKKINMILIAEMAQWVNESVKKLGHEKTEAILDVIEVAGYLKPELKNILIKLAKRIPAEDIAKTSSTQDYIALMLRIEDLVGMNSRSNELGLLSIFCQEV
ncbi:MAG: hypothetical protein PHE50_01860 [Dehalococcoidales bacterium]|nr:hypothetical protein [Dehalococcoidales bacterium]